MTANDPGPTFAIHVAFADSGIFEDKLNDAIDLCQNSPGSVVDIKYAASSFEPDTMFSAVVFCREEKA